MAELLVSKKSISKLLSEMQNRKFVIPDFQRPYKWDVEKCETLWNDIENFTQTDAKTGSDYFLGTIVSYINKDRNQEIIDGQQRITSFFLLLRAFFRRLELMDEHDKDVIGLKNQLAPCIWDIDSISQVVSDKTRIHIESLVATEEDNETFHNILKTGLINELATDNYTLNYRYFEKRSGEYAKANPMQWKQLCVTILQKCIILPIECDTPETALTIFSTLNDRGLPLADSDIFKAQIYRSLKIEVETGIDDKLEAEAKHKTEAKRREFTNTWKELTQICKQAHVSIDDVFRYYTHVLRARSSDKSKEVGLRKFYAENEYSRLKHENLVDEIMVLAKFWRYLNVPVKYAKESDYNLSDRTRQYVHCLTYYPNEFWKYATSVFFLKNYDSPTFDIDLGQMLQKLVAFLFVRFIEAPSVNAIKDDIYGACIALQQHNKLEFKSVLNEESIHIKIDEQASSRLSRALLLLSAYLNPSQEQVIIDTFDIEHIFPKKWLDANYNGWSKSDADLYLDRFGNKIVFERKLNIQAGNGYFGRKKQDYSKSNIASVQELGEYQKNDWVKDDIELRETKFKENLIAFFRGQLASTRL